MRSISQKILVDRLAHALKTRGVDLKRSAVLEIAAQAFGHADSNHLAAAAKAGELDPPYAVAASHDGRAFAWLKDPVADGVFAYQPDMDGGIPSAFVLSPYGNILTVPEDSKPVSERDDARTPTPSDPWTVGTDDENRTYQQVGRARDIVRLDCGSTHDGMTGLGKYGLDRFSSLVDVDVDMNPFVTLTGIGVSLVDGRHHLTYVATIEYDGHYMATAALAEMQSVAFSAADAIRATGCVLRWTDDPRYGNLEIELHIPESALIDLQDEEQLEDAILTVLGSPGACRESSLKEVGDPDPMQEATGSGTYRIPRYEMRCRQSDDGSLPEILHEDKDGDRFRKSEAVVKARSLRFDEHEIDFGPENQPKAHLSGSLALVDGSVRHAVTLRYRYAPQDASSNEAVAAIVGGTEERFVPLLERLGAIWRIEGNAEEMTVTAHLPIHLSARVSDRSTWIDALAHLFGDRRNGVVQATYVPQAWVEDHAVDVDPEGPTGIDITWEVLTMDAEEAVSFRDNQEFTEGLTDSLLAPDWIRHRRGPSSIRARDAVDGFLVARQDVDTDGERTAA